MGLYTTTKKISNVLSDVRRTFGDEASVQVTDADVIRWVNSAQREILVTNKILKAVGTTNIIAGVSEYSMSNLSIMAIQSIHCQGKKLDYKSFQEAEEYILDADPTKSLSDTPVLWYEWGGVINIYPIPNQNITDGLRIYYIREPSDLTAVTDTLTVPDMYYENVLQYVLSKAYELDEDTENSNYKLGQFVERLNQLSEQENSPQIDTYPRITILEEDM